jgi:serine protease Do/serine protease DegQ
MNPKTVSALLTLGLATWTAVVPAMAMEAVAAPAKPALQVDASPVGPGHGAVVTSYADVVEPVQRAVVSVYSTKIVAQRVRVDPLAQLFGAPPDQFREHKEEGLGSGVIVSKDGYIITNNHVVEGADELSVLLPDDREFKATVVGTDPKTDIAVIKIKATDLPTVVLADSDKLRVGDIVFAVGNPLGVGQTVTMGIVSAKGRTHLGLLEKVAGYEDFIQTDAAINMGNSGGALIDAKGRLVGINSAIVSTSRGSIGIGFAIPVNLAASIMRSLIATGTVARGSLGVSGETLTPEIADSLGLPKDTRGVTISDVTPEGPADKAGLKRNDVVLAVNDRAVTSQEDMRLVIAQSAPGSKVTLHLMRNGKALALTATLDRLEEHPHALMTGVEATPLTEDQLQRLNLDPRVTGLVITRVAQDSPYADRLVAGLVIVEINRAAVTDVATARAQLHQGRNLLLIYYRGRFRYLTLTLDKR